MKLVAESLNELYHFERKGNPLEKMGIGREEYLKEISNSIKWDWDINRNYNEKVLDIIKYKGYLIKISEIFPTDGYKIHLGFMSVSNTGQTYFEKPTIFDNSEESLFSEQIFIDEI